MRRIFVWAGVVALGEIGAFGGTPARAADVAVARNGEDPCEEPVIDGYEPNVFGYTKQGDDEPFVDITISVKTQLFPNLICRNFQGRHRLYLTFTGRFGFYVGTRHSSPVIAKNFNPKLLWRMIPDTANTTLFSAYGRKAVSLYSSYIDFAYAHDSNGQSIDSLQEYEVQASQVGGARDALDFISRGWDYVQAAGQKTWFGGRLGSGALSLYPDVKFFLRHGLLQGVPEEFHSWEVDTHLRPRHAFDGLSAGLEYRPYAGLIGEDPRTVPWKSGLRFELKLTSGYDPLMRFDTVRGEVGFYVLELPLTVWAQDGYLDSLARYYKRTVSGGLELRFVEF